MSLLLGHGSPSRQVTHCSQVRIAGLTPVPGVSSKLFKLLRICLQVHRIANLSIQLNCSKILVYMPLVRVQNRFC